MSPARALYIVELIIELVQDTQYLLLVLGHQSCRVWAKLPVLTTGHLASSSRQSTRGSVLSIRSLSRLTVRACIIVSGSGEGRVFSFVNLVSVWQYFFYLMYRCLNDISARHIFIHITISCQRKACENRKQAHSSLERFGTLAREIQLGFGFWPLSLLWYFVAPLQLGWLL